MSEEKKVRLRIVSSMQEPQGEIYETKHARRGILRCDQEEIMLEYDDEQEQERAHIVLSILPGRTAAEHRVKMQRKGMTSGVLTFLPGQKVSSCYVTMYGEIPIQIDTRRISVAQQKDGGALQLDYDVYMGGERTSSANMEITWRL